MFNQDLSPEGNAVLAFRSTHDLSEGRLTSTDRLMVPLEGTQGVSKAFFRLGAVHSLYSCINFTVLQQNKNPALFPRWSLLSSHPIQVRHLQVTRFTVAFKVFRRLHLRIPMCLSFREFTQLTVDRYEN